MRARASLAKQTALWCRSCSSGIARRYEESCGRAAIVGAKFLSGPIDLNLGSRDAQRPVFHPAGATGGIYARPLKAGGEIFSRPRSASAGRRVWRRPLDMEQQGSAAERGSTGLQGAAAVRWE